MSGHSKWSNIKHKKEKSDAAKAKVFTKIGKEMAIAVRDGGLQRAKGVPRVAVRKYRNLS